MDAALRTEIRRRIDSAKRAQVRRGRGKYEKDGIRGPVFPLVRVPKLSGIARAAFDYDGRADL